MGEQQQKTQGQNKTPGQMDKDQSQWDKSQGQMDKDRQSGGQTGQTPQFGTHGNPKAGTGNDTSSQQQRDMRQGDATKPAQPSGTTPLERDQEPVRKER